MPQIPTYPQRTLGTLDGTEKVVVDVGGTTHYVTVGDLEDYTQEVPYALIGIPEGDPDLGAFLGSTIDDALNVKQALQQLETAVETVASGGVPDGDKGDITVSTSGTVWTIDANAVTYAKLPNMAQYEVLGRVTSGTGNVEALTRAQQKTAIGLTAGTITSSTPWTNSQTWNGSGVDFVAQLIDITNTDSGSGALAFQIKVDGSPIFSVSKTGAITNTEIDSLVTLSGVAANSTHFGAFTGSVLTDSTTAKANLQELGTAIDSLVTLSGNILNAQDNGSFTGSVLTDSTTTRANLQEVGTAIDSLVTLSGNILNAQDNGSFTGRVLTDSTTTRANLQELGTAVDDLTTYLGMSAADQGLVGDGSTDDTSALQTLLTAGGTIYLPEGTFKVVWSTGTQGLLMPKPGTRLIGRGKGKTTIRFVPAAAPTASTSYGLRVYTDTVTIPDDCVIEGITFEQTSNVNEGKIVRMVEFRGADRCVMRDCEIIGTDAISTYTVHDGYLHGNQGPSQPLTFVDCDFTLIENVECRDGCGEEWNTNGAYGLEVDSCQNFRAVACDFTNNYFDGVKVLDNSSRTQDVTFVACNASNNGQVEANSVVENGTGNHGNGNGFDIDGSSIRCIGCTADYNYGAGFQAKGNDRSDVTFESCTARFNRTSNTDKQAGFAVYVDNGTYLTNSASAVMANNNVRIINCESIENDGIGIDVNVGVQCQVAHCTVRSNGTLGIRLGTNAVRCKVSDNHVLGNGRTDGTSTAYGIHVNGAGNVVSDNWISGIDTLREGDEDQVDYRTRTPYTDRGIQINATTGAECNFIFRNIIEEVAAGLYIQRTSGEAVYLGNYQADGTVITDGHFGP